MAAVITEFLPDVGWAEYNTINCAAALHFMKGAGCTTPSI
jgi:hypothetical protein